MDHDERTEVLARDGTKDLDRILAREAAVFAAIALVILVLLLVVR